MFNLGIESYFGETIAVESAFYGIMRIGVNIFIYLLGCFLWDRDIL